MSVTRKFGSSVAWMAAGNWTEQAINFAVFVTLARLLGTEAYGLLAMAMAFIVLCEALVRESVSEYLIAADDPTPEDYNAVFWLLFGLGVLIAVALWVLSGPIARAYGQDEVRGLIRALSPSVIMIALTGVPVAILRRELQFRILSLRAVAGVITGGIVGIGMALAGYGVWSFAGQWLVLIATNIVMAWSAVSWRPGLFFTRDHAAKAAGFGTQVLGLRAAELAMTQTPTLIIGLALGPHATGLFSMAWRLVETLSFLIVTPLRMASQPAFAAITREGGRSADLLLDIARLTGPAAFPAFAGVAVLAPQIIALVFGAEWTEAAPVLVVLAALGPYFCIAKVQQSFCLAAGRAGAITALSWAGVALGLVLTFVAARWGLTAISAAFVLAHYLLWPLRYKVVARIGGGAIGPLISCHLVPLAATAVMALVVAGVAHAAADMPLPVLLVLAIAAGVAVFGALTLIFMRERLGLVRSYVARPKKMPDHSGT